MPEETSTTAVYTTVTQTATTPNSRRTLSFKMVEEQLVPDTDEQPDQPRGKSALTQDTNHHTPHGTPHSGGGAARAATAAGEPQSGMHHHLTSGRHSPHIPSPLHLHAPSGASSGYSTPLSSRKHISRPHSPLDWAEPGKVYTQAYLPADHQPTYLLGQHGPQPSKIPNYHTPEGQGVKIVIPSRRRGMDFLVNACVSQLRENGQYNYASFSGRRSPHMNNEEPITMSTYPDARPVPDSVQPKIERDDFPAPPYAYTDPERIRRYQQATKKAFSVASDEEPDAAPGKNDDDDGDVIVDPAKAAEAARQAEHARREAQELKKISSGIGKVFLHDVEERAKHRQGKWRQGIDPRNASRTASANREPHIPPRYGSPAFASPSRLDDRPRPWEDWEFTPPPQTKWRSASSGASTLPSYSIPRPGYGLSTATTPKSATLPQGLGRSSPGIPDLIFEDGTFVSDEMQRTQSGEFASTTLPDYLYSERSARAFLDAHLVRSRIVEPYFQADFLEAVENTTSGTPRKERKVYPLQQLLVTNRKFPDDVDRNHLELHLSPEDFMRALHMPRDEFFRLPDWKRSELKKRAKLY